MRKDIYGANNEICKIDTAHNAVILQRRDNRLELRDAAGALQSCLDLDRPHRLAMRNLECLAAVTLFVPPPRRILLLGTAAGSLLHFFRHHYPAELHAVDIDRELIRQLQDRGILPEPDERLTYHHADALRFIDDCEARFDLILFDIFDGSQSPAWLGEKDTLNRLYQLLAPRGALAFNLIIDSERDFSRFYRQLQTLCRHQTLSTPVENLENTIVFGFRDQLPERELDWYLERTLDLSREHGIDYWQILASIYTSNPQGTI